MEQIIITHPDGSKMPLVSKQNVSAVTKAEQIVGLLADDIVNISVQSATTMQFALGDTIEVYGKTYTLNQLPVIKKNGERRFSYDLVFEGVQYELLDAQFLLPNNTVGDSFTGNLFAFLKILVSNANRVFPGKWADGEYPAETEYKTLTFTGDNCLSVLQRLCEEYGQEFEITQTGGMRILHIKKAGVNFPYTFRYGRTGGLYELNRQNINSKNIVTRLFVYGGSNNVQNSYLTARGSNKLCLPDKNKNTSYIQNAEAVANFGVKENTKTFDTIFPNRYGEVTAKGSKYYAFVDNTMTFDLNEKGNQGNTLWLIAGVAAKVHFNTGNLAGYEFDVHKYDHATKTIELVPFTDENGMKFPSETSAAFQFKPGDKYFFIDINLPDKYIEEAEQKLKTEAEEYYVQNSQPQVQYGLTIDENFIKQFAGNLTGVTLFAVGNYIPVQDADMGVDKSVRITGFTRDLLKPYKYAITLGDAVTKSTFIRMIADRCETDRIIEINNLADPSKARRNWRASQEVLSMVFDPEGDYYSDKIKPLSIETTMLQVGAKSMQFVLQNVIFEPNYQGKPNYLRISGGNLIHYTIEDTIRNWTIAVAEFSTLANDTAYYIYARCQQSGNAGNIIIDTTQRKVDYEPGYYTFMIGVLNSVETDSDGNNPARLISLTYGSSTINGRFIKTGRIESSGGTGSFFDLDGNQFRIGNAEKGLSWRGLSWNENNDKRLILKGTFVQSQSGEEFPLGCPRGAYNDNITYDPGDEVTYNGSSYRQIHNAPITGIPPANETYWTITAAKGKDAQVFYTWIKYADSTTGAGISDNPTGKKYIGFAYNKTTATESNNPADYMWSLIAGTDGVPGEPGADGRTLYTWIKYSDYADGTNMYDVPNDNTMYIGIAVNKTTASESTDKADYTWSKFKGDQGVPGKDGNAGAIPVFRGEYSHDAAYYGNKDRIDIVSFGGVYYKTLKTSGTFSGEIPTNENYWELFGGQFESVATSVLFSEMANLGGFIFKNNKLISQSGTINNQMSTDYADNLFVPNIQIDAINGIITVGGKIILDNDYGIAMLNTKTDCIATYVIPETVGTIANLNNMSAKLPASYSLIAERFYYYTSSFDIENTITYKGVIGNLNNGDELQISDVYFSFILPYTDSGSLTLFAAFLSVIVKCNDTQVEAFTNISMRTGSIKSGEYVTGSKSSATIIRIIGTSNGYASGNYTVELSLKFQAKADPASIAKSFRIDFYQQITGTLGRKTVVGIDGLYTYWGTDQYFFISHNEGIQMRIGNNGFRLTAAYGLQKMTDGNTWAKL